MSEPLSEVAEESWLEYLNRFDNEIYPTLFRRYGYTRAEALTVWTLAQIRSDLEALRETIEAERS